MKRKYSDSEIVEGIKKGGKPKELILLWLCKHRKYINHSRIECKKLGIRNSDDQFGVFNDSILELYKAIEAERYDFDKATIMTYWKGIYRNKCLKHLERNSSPSFEELHENMPIPKQEDTSSNIKEILDRFRLASSSCAELLTLVVANYEANDIAERMGYSTANVVGVTKARCIKKLRKFMRDDESR